jgi:hypothetical protein
VTCGDVLLEAAIESHSAIIFRFVADRGSDWIFASDSRHAEVRAAVSSYCERKVPCAAAKKSLGLSRRRYTPVNQADY